MRNLGKILDDKDLVTKEYVDKFNEVELIATDYTPYLYRTAPSFGQPYNRQRPSVVGGSVGWNQLFDSDGLYTTTESGVTYTKVSNYEWSINGTATGQNTKSVMLGTKFVNGHVYFVGGFNSFNGQLQFLFGNTYFSADTISKYSGTQNLVLRHTATASFTNNSLKMQVIDLTALFGSSVADAIYAMEQSVSGSGVAYFKTIIGDEYIPFNSGSLESVQTSAHKIVGFNQWDEEWEVGGLAWSNGGNNNSMTGRIRSKNYNPALPNTTYYIKTPVPVYPFYYDANKGLIRYEASSKGNTTITTPSNACYIRFFTASDAYGTTYNNDICINISDANLNGQYKPYESWSYPLDPIVLRGIPKWENGQLKYDGDVYHADGTVERRYGIVDLGTLNWARSGVTMLAQNLSPVAKDIGLSTVPNAKCLPYTSVKWSDVTNSNDGTICVTSYQIRVMDSRYTDATAFKTAMSGIYLVYELATPTTETATPYTALQMADPQGTEEWVTSGIVPVGQETEYGELKGISFNSQSNGVVEVSCDGSEDYSLASTAYADVAGGNAKIFYGVCSTAAATVEKAVICNDFKSEDLIPGTIITVKFDNTNSGAIGSITLNVNETGAKSIKYIYNGSISNIPGAGYLKSGQAYQFYYDGTYWVVQMIYNTDADWRVRHDYGRFKAGSNGILPYSIVMQTIDGRWESIVTTYSTDTKQRNTHGFLLPMIFFRNSNAATVTENSIDSTWQFNEENLVDSRYSFNITNVAGNRFTAGDSVYLVGTISNGAFYLADDWWAVDLPTTEDGKYYVYLGNAYDWYRFNLATNHPIYVYKGSAMRMISADSLAVNGHTVNSDVPSGAVFTDTQSDWSVTDTTSKAYIENKPTIPSKTTDLTNDSNFVSDSSYVHTDNNYTTIEKNKLAGIATGAEMNVQSDWNETDTTSDAYIKNKPTIPSAGTGTNYPTMDGTRSLGSNAGFARVDHVHPSDTSRVPTTRQINSKALSSDVTLYGTDIYTSSASGADTITNAIQSIGTATTTAFGKLYGECETTASTATKAVTIENYSTGTNINPFIYVKFKYTNTAAVANLTLKVNNGTAYSIKYRGNNLPSVGTLAAGRVYCFVFDGTYWALVGDLDTGEVNQNAFSNVKVGSTTIAADSKTDTLELAAGDNITLTPDATNDKVTIGISTIYGLITIAEHTLSTTISTTSSTTVQADITKAGYWPLGVVGWRAANGSGSGGSYFQLWELEPTSIEEGKVTVKAGIRASGGSITNCTLYVKILWMKA